MVTAVSAPLLSALVACLIRLRYSWLTAISSTFLLLISAAVTLLIFMHVWPDNSLEYSIPWFTLAGNQISAGIYLDNVSALMMMLITTISFLVHFYSAGYMAGDAAMRRYFAMLGFFTFSMLGLVLSSNLLLLFFFWELVGFSSYMLIGHWTDRPDTGSASKKAFIMNRISDLGFLAGLLIVWSNAGSFDLQYLAQLPDAAAWQTAAALCFLWGAIGKSAQFPLFTWLKDAMAGPTPVSALIHAATMVTAGVFLLVRTQFIFTPETLNVVAVTGMITTLAGGLCALYQYDIKKILAFSTISQLGFMMTALGAGAVDAFSLHLFTHAFFKAGLFLAAGSVIHTLHHALHESAEDFDVQDIRNLGGIRKSLPLTFTIFVVCGAALSGVPFFSGFLSKDAIIAHLINWAQNGDAWRWTIVSGAFITTFITGMYTFRLIWFVFLRNGNDQLTRLKISEAPFVMRIPMMILAACSLWLIVSSNPIHTSGWLLDDQNSSRLLAFASAIWVALALLSAYLIFRKKNPEYKTSSLANLFYNSLYLDGLYQKGIVHPLKKISDYTLAGDRRVIDRFIHFAAYAQVTVAHLTGWFDRTFIDGMVNGIARLTGLIGQFTRSFQGGKIQHYIFWSALSMIVLVLLLLL